MNQILAARIQWVFTLSTYNCLFEEEMEMLAFSNFRNPSDNQVLLRVTKNPKTLAQARCPNIIIVSSLFRVWPLFIKLSKVSSALCHKTQTCETKITIHACVKNKIDGRQLHKVSYSPQLVLL